MNSKAGVIMLTCLWSSSINTIFITTTVAPPHQPLLSLISTHPPVLTPYPLLDDALGHLIAHLAIASLSTSLSITWSTTISITTSPHLRCHKYSVWRSSARLVWVSSGIHNIKGLFFGTARSESKPRMENEHGVNNKLTPLFWDTFFKESPANILKAIASQRRGS